jgi:uncharacterized membrane protein
MIGINGIKLFFKDARSLAIYSIVATSILIVAFIVFVAAMIIVGAGMSESEYTAMQQRDEAAMQQFLSPSEPQDVIVPVVREVAIQFGLVVIGLLIFGVMDYAAGRLATGKNAELGVAFKTVLGQFPAYLWMYVLMIVKVLLWSLLLIVPGVIMANRYILAGTVFFAEGKRGNAALKRSADLTKNAWLTTYGGVWSWSFISQGLATYVFYPGATATLYRQLAPLTDAGKPKPAAHILSWLVLLVPIAVVVLYILFMVLLFTFIATAPTAP